MTWSSHEDCTLVLLTKVSVEDETFKEFFFESATRDPNVMEWCEKWSIVIMQWIYTNQKKEHDLSLVYSIEATIIMLLKF